MFNLIKDKDIICSGAEKSRLAGRHLHRVRLKSFTSLSALRKPSIPRVEPAPTPEALRFRRILSRLCRRRAPVPHLRLPRHHLRS
jgi:hypothetical protein